MPASTDKSILPAGTLDLEEQILPRRKTLVSRVEDRQWTQLPTERISIRVRSTAVGGAYSIIEGILPPLSGPPLHIHQNEDEIFEVLEGNVRFVCEGEMFDAPVGTNVVIPKGARHTWKNMSATQDARVLAVFSPGGLEAMFEEFEGKELAELEEIARRHGTILVGPPL